LTSDLASVVAAMEAIEASLRRRFRVVESTADIDGRAITLLHPASAEELISEDDFARDERLPYWAELWPSSRILAARLASMHGNGRRLLELGCGSGLVASCAAAAGFDVTASDYYEDATLFSRVNAWRIARRAIGALTLDWRALPPDLPRFELVVASDVLYERPYGPLVAATIAASLAPGGVAIVADPGRVARDAFLDALGQNDLQLSGKEEVAYVAGEIRQTITLYTIGFSR
jgi:predicted nicotinamide N-methyase